MDLITLNWPQILENLVRIAIAFLLALPLGWERKKGRESIGLRTFPIVAMASCGFALVAKWMPEATPETHARVIQGVITGIGFIGGGAILKHGADVRGLVTAASIWNTGAIGVAVAYAREEIAIVLAIINVVALVCLTPIAEKVDDGGGKETKR